MMGTTVERCGGLGGGFVPCRTQMGEKLASIINGSRLQGEMDQMWLLVELVPQKHKLFVVHRPFRPQAFFTLSATISFQKLLIW